MVRRKKSEASLVNKTSLRVRFSEVDSMQIVWHGEYVRYFEDGREAFGREFAGLGYMGHLCQRLHGADRRVAPAIQETAESE